MSGTLFNDAYRYVDLLLTVPLLLIELTLVVQCSSCLGWPVHPAHCNALRIPLLHGSLKVATDEYDALMKRSDEALHHCGL